MQLRVLYLVSKTRVLASHYLFWAGLSDCNQFKAHHERIIGRLIHTATPGERCYIEIGRLPGGGPDRRESLQQKRDDVLASSSSRCAFPRLYSNVFTVIFPVFALFSKCIRSSDIHLGWPLLFRLLM